MHLNELVRHVVRHVVRHDALGRSCLAHPHNSLHTDIFSERV